LIVIYDRTIINQNKQESYDVVSVQSITNQDETIF